MKISHIVFLTSFIHYSLASLYAVMRRDINSIENVKPLDELPVLIRRRGDRPEPEIITLSLYIGSFIRYQQYEYPLEDEEYSVAMDLQNDYFWTTLNGKDTFTLYATPEIRPLDVIVPAYKMVRDIYEDELIMTLIFEDYSDLFISPVEGVFYGSLHLSVRQKYKMATIKSWNDDHDGYSSSSS